MQLSHSAIFRTVIYLFSCVSLIQLQACKQVSATSPAPKPIGDDEEDLEQRRAAYIELIHRAAPGVNWRQVEEQNSVNNYYRFVNRAAGRTTTTFAGGAITGNWYERGNTNLAGRMDEFAYIPGTNTLYAMSAGGSLWRTALPAVSWIKTSDKAKFRSNVLAAIPRVGGGARVFVSTGLKIWHTDNNGVTFDTSATGITYPVAWGGNYVYKIIPVNDAAATIYCVTFAWDPVSWTAMFHLYSSVDSGMSFSLIRKFPYHNDNQLAFCSPLTSPDLYALGVSSSAADTLFRISSSVTTVLSTTNTFAAADNVSRMKCVENSGVTHFYALTGGSHFYHSTNFGTNWRLKSTIAADDNFIIGASAQNPGKVAYGNVEANRSADTGATWTLVNTWGSYYGAMSTNLHADLHNFIYFRYASGTEFGIVSTDGGAYITNDEISTVSNISLTGLNVNQLWDHITDPADANIIFGGAQDQGLQTTNAAGGTGMITETQVISGDYGQLRITGGGNTLWPEYPGGNMYLYQTLASPGYIGSWTMSGSQKPNAGWMLPTSEYFTSSLQDVILIGGGEISGDTGSYLVRLTLSMAGGFSVTPYQYPYNFRPNSNNGRSGISSIAISRLSSSYIYVGAEDGTFFYSTDAGSTWNKTLSFAGLAGDWLYGATILASADTIDKVYFGGSGYSNPGVFVSRNHGISFTPMSTGLPATLVYKLAAYANDSFVFAATDAGPYVYVQADNKWYSLADANTPAADWRSVEYIPSIHTVRYGTYGRGIWDFVLAGSPLTTTLAHPAAPVIQLAPNPLLASQQLRLISAVQQNVQLSVFTMSGKLVWSGQTATNAGIDLHSLAGGAYICTITAPGGGTANSMLIVN